MQKTELSWTALVLLLGMTGASSCGGADDPDSAGETDTGNPTVADGAASEPCEPACVGNTECFEGVLCQSPGTNLGGACGGALAFPEPECDACVRDTCCAELQGCFGDETISSPTACAEHYVCVIENAPDCSEAASFEEFEECMAAQMPSQCSSTAEQQNAVDALRSCALDCGCHSPAADSE